MVDFLTVSRRSLAIIAFVNVISIVVWHMVTLRQPLSISPTYQSTSLSMEKKISDYSDYDPNRLCTQNQYANALNLPLNDTAGLMDQWLANKTLHEKTLMANRQNMEHNHGRFDAFQVMGECNVDCIGGECRRDTSKIVCGGTAVRDPCVVYSIGGNNQWEFEQDILQKTPCEVHTFDCTGPIERFQKPDNDRLHFHHVCLGTANVPAPKTPPTKDSHVGGEFWTLEKMQKTLKHTQIDLFKIDIEGKCRFEEQGYEKLDFLTPFNSIFINNGLFSFPILLFQDTSFHYLIHGPL